MREAITYIKRCRLCFTRYLSGSPLERQEGVWISKGLPVRLAWLKGLLGDEWGQRIVLTLLTSLRDELLPPSPDLDPITGEWKGSLPALSRSEHLTICKELGINSRRNLVWRKFHTSTKKGPQGQAIVSAIPDLFALPPDLKEHICVLGGNPLRQKIASVTAWTWDSLSLLDVWNRIFPRKKEINCFRKLSYFSDKEGKTRVIGILDYWSQTALYPLHTELNSILLKISSDCTFDQSSFYSKLPKEGPFFSFDLTNATDRLPIDLQVKVIGRILGRRKAEAWREILTRYPFQVKLPNKETTEVLYKAGQPMGAYSSWPALALTHHYIVRLAALRSGLTGFKDYVLLGDDIVIANATVAHRYQELMKLLDVPISVTKTHVSNDTYEFAKRWVHKGVEITPFSLGGLLECWKRYSHLQNFIQNQCSHGWNIGDDRHPSLIVSILKLLGRKEQAPRILKLYMVFKSLVETRQRKVTDGRLWNSLSTHFGLPQLPQDRLPDLEDQIIWTVKTETLENDYTKAQEILYDMEELYLRKIKESCVGLDDQSYKSFRELVPVYCVVKDALDSVVDYVNFYIGNAEDNLDDDNWGTSDTISVFTRCRSSLVSGTIFSERKANTVLHSSARMIKLLITEAKRVIPYDLR